MRFIKYCTIMSMLYFLSGCSLFSLNTPDQRIALFSEAYPKSSGKPISISVALTNTTATPFLSTNAIIIRSGNLISKLKGAVWTDPIPSLINNTLLSTLRSSSRFTSISTDVDGIIAFYTIQTSLTQWNIEIRNGQYFVVGELYANIISKKNGTIFEQHRWLFEQKIPNLEIKTVSDAFESIMKKITPEFIEWAELSIEFLTEQNK